MLLLRQHHLKLHNMYILIALLLTVIAFVIDWLKDKTSADANIKANWIKYVAMFVAGAFLFGYLFQLQSVRYIFAGLVAIGVYFFWTFLANLFKPKPPTT